MRIAVSLGAAFLLADVALGAPRWVPSARVEDGSVWAVVGGARAVAWSDHGEAHHAWVPKRWEALDAVPQCGGAVVLRYHERKSTFVLDVLRDDDEPTAVWSVTARARQDVLMAYAPDGTWLVDTVAGQLHRVGCEAVTPTVALSEPRHSCSRAGQTVPCPSDHGHPVCAGQESGAGAGPQRGELP